MKTKKRKTLYSLLDSYKYTDGIFGAGLVKHSKHPINKVFLKINAHVFELRHDEAYAIITSLSKVLWCDYQYRKQDKVKLKWKSIEQLTSKRKE